MLRKSFPALTLALIAAVSIGQDLAGQPADDGPNFHARAVASHLRVVPGQRFHIAVDLRIADGWVYYSPDPGEIAMPGEIQTDAPRLEVGSVLWPKDYPKETDLVDRVVVNNVYVGRAVAYVPVKVPDGLPVGRYPIVIDARGQICDIQTGICVSVSSPITATADVVVGPMPTVNTAWRDDPAIAEGLPSAMTEAELVAFHGASAPAPSRSIRAPELAVSTGLGLALLAGLILNVMPCVLPVIPLRIISISQMAGQSRRRFVTLGLAFSGGIVLFFVGLAAANVVLRVATDRAFNWSEHFQLPAVRVGLALLIVALAGNLFGLFNVTVPRRVAALEAGAPSGRRGAGHVGSAGMGLMMAILATPCSFAILALAMAWAQLQPLWLGTLAIVAIGVGMACPHAILSAFPQLVDKLPRPGNWTERLKQTMGFALLPVAIWLIGTLSENGYVSWVLAFAVVLAFGLWVWGTWVRYDAPLKKKLLVRGLTVVIVVAAGFWMLVPSAPLAVEFAAFDEAALARAAGDNQVVLVKFTAAWCLSCKWVDAAVYDNADVAAELAGRDLLVMKADVTNAGSAASKYLTERFGGAPPLTVVFPAAGGDPILLEGKFAISELISALDTAAGS